MQLLARHAVVISRLAEERIVLIVRPVGEQQVRRRAMQ
jgi:hypothetical protein